MAMVAGLDMASQQAGRSMSGNSKLKGLYFQGLTL